MIQLCFSNISFVTNETSASKKPVCKKCKSKDLSKDIDGFPLCVHCGWVDYSKDIPKAKQPKAIKNSFCAFEIHRCWEKFKRKTVTGLCKRQ